MNIPIAIDCIKKVFIIDDSVYDRFIAEEVITATNLAIEVISADSAQKGLDYLLSKAGQPDDLPALILLDIKMPGLDGFDFLERFEMMPEVVKTSCKIVMLTSSINPEDMRRAYKSKYVQNYLYKPLEGHKLNELFVTSSVKGS